MAAASSSMSAGEVDEFARNVNDSRQTVQVQPRLHKPVQQRSTVAEMNTCRFLLKTIDQETVDNRCICFQMVFANSLSCGPAIYHWANIEWRWCHVITIDICWGRLMSSLMNLHLFLNILSNSCITNPHYLIFKIFSRPEIVVWCVLWSPRHTRWNGSLK